MKLHIQNEALRETLRFYGKTLLYSYLIGVIVIMSLALALVWSSLQPQGRVSCASFGLWSDASKAFNKGALWLDGDKDGIPCEGLLSSTKVRGF